MGRSIDRDPPPHLGRGPAGSPQKPPRALTTFCPCLRCPASEGSTPNRQSCGGFSALLRGPRTSRGEPIMANITNRYHPLYDMLSLQDSLVRAFDAAVGRNAQAEPAAKQQNAAD